MVIGNDGFHSLLGAGMCQKAKTNPPPKIAPKGPQKDTLTSSSPWTECRRYVNHIPMFGNQPSDTPDPFRTGRMRVIANHQVIGKTGVLVGLMGAAKPAGPNSWPSACIGRPDSDHEIEQVGGLAIHEIFDRFGEEKFRELGTPRDRDVLSGAPMVMATAARIR